jgi:hypothetical protein
VKIWLEKVNEEICKNVEQNIKREEESGFTQRSELKIYYTTLGELSQIVGGNWDAFSDIFNIWQKCGRNWRGLKNGKGERPLSIRHKKSRFTGCLSYLHRF